jgi:hypothetical protein
LGPGDFAPRRQLVACPESGADDGEAECVQRGEAFQFARLPSMAQWKEC